MQRSPRMLVLAASLSLAACAEQSPLLPTDSGPGFGTRSALLDRAPVERPLRGHCQTEFAFLPPTPDQPANVQRLLISHTCQLAHLGRTTGTSVQVVTGGETGSLIATTTTYTSANGDQLFASFTGTGTFPDAEGLITFHGTETYLGGTGRFAGASGSAALAGSASAVTSTGSFETVGTLIY